jgi:hypothetical protein
MEKEKDRARERDPNDTFNRLNSSEITSQTTEKEMIQGTAKKIGRGS